MAAELPNRRSANPQSGEGEELAMRAFAVIFTEHSPKGIERLEALFPSTYELVPRTVYIVKSPSVSGPDYLARSIGIKGEDRDSEGVVFRLGTGYAGHTKKTLWGWLDDE